MSFRKKITISLLLFSAVFYCQDTHSEIGIITDNDLYTSTINDMYYTNGLEIFYRHHTPSNNFKIYKKTIEFKLGQYIYTPSLMTYEESETMERPYASYLFGEVGRSFFYKNESVLKANLRLGYLGPNAFGREVQNNFHDLVGYPKFKEWDYQIQNALAIQTHFLFSKRVFQKNDSEFVDFHFRSKANLGTIFTGVSTGLLSRMSLKKLAPVYNSTLYDGAVGSNESEFYFFIATNINYQLYDATIQGSLFSNNSPVTFRLIPIRFNGEAGVKYRKNKLNLSYTFMYKGKESHSPKGTGYFYGSIGLSYLL
ncbi:lipid A deacylase LpxR family protein [Flavobacterium algicola]|uniref:lipid A deacylase LpxR family protein n=1 Tax=Flavobacterium algicola TaxID=556529 RepID=UPI001EFCD5BF|nr:lipid A deacylase LpxR family protein [Flavobacterium algicola]MCG9792132.1 lipid A deacylase LpxR family protein [Flavobacterium algicola]